jgi:hypothetical protein
MKKSELPWKFRPDKLATARWASAVELIRAIAGASLVSEKHRKKLLRIAIYELTEVHGKWNLRFKTRDSEGRSRSKVCHEHVIGRKALAEEMLKHPNRVAGIAKKAIACLVTRQEHRKLHKTGSNRTGWDRYKAAGIVVIDTKTGRRASI